MDPTYFFERFQKLLRAWVRALLEFTCSVNFIFKCRTDPKTKVTVLLTAPLFLRVVGNQICPKRGFWHRVDMKRCRETLRFVKSRALLGVSPRRNATCKKPPFPKSYLEVCAAMFRWQAQGNVHVK